MIHARAEATRNTKSVMEDSRLIGRARYSALAEVCGLAVHVVAGLENLSHKRPPLLSLNSLFSHSKRNTHSSKPQEGSNQEP
jgi:hypothetical protein